MGILSMFILASGVRSAVPWSGLPAGLHESQCHPIRLADRQILGALFITEPERRRQGPHAFRIVLGVLRVVVDRRFRIEAEARSARQFLDVVLVHVAGLTHLLETGDRKSTRLNSSHRTISYAVFCLKKNNLNAENMDR